MNKMKISPINSEYDESAIAELCHKLRLPGVYRAYLEQLQDPSFAQLSFTNRLGVTLQRECDERTDRHIKRLIKNTKIADDMVDIGVITFEKERKLDQAQVMELATCRWIMRDRPLNLIITGQCGTGKTWLAKALGKQACYQSLSTFFIRMSGLVEMFDEAREQKTRIALREKLNKYKLLIIDDFALTTSLSDENRDFLLTILDDRLHRASVIITSQRGWDSWYDWFGESYESDAILDRLKHSSEFIHLEGPSLRKKWVNQ